MGTDGYERLGQSAAERIAKIEPRWDIDWLGMANTELKETQT